MGKTIFGVLALMIAATLSAQDSLELAAAKALDEKIAKVNDLPEGQREQSIRDLVRQVRTQPKQFRRTLADNLAISISEATPLYIQQEVVDILAGEMRDLPAGSRDYADEYLHLAEFAAYSHLHVTLTDPRYLAELKKLEDLRQRRERADFSLTDVEGRKWNLKMLRGKVVLVNFWATWCPPCVRELPDLNTVFRRFKSENFVVLAITEEDAATVRKFVIDHVERTPTEN